MPALKLCGRRLRMAGDDLGPYAILRLVMDAICMTLMLVASLRFRFWSGYPFSWGTAYVNGSFALFAVEAAVMVAMLIVSTRGGITEQEKRRPMPFLVAMFLVLVLLELACTCAGIHIVLQ